ncbi:hypothetical protein jhhlp_005163 [Lomentospora prolificans]|uniref:Methyltransferase domain-containing protein n=1 Tax=Lomentospora prolificans TaxID=41688 RepID=A0A2N3N712_9PEZI|nr:hypothetical protein jhhlp_005163 [Lomentospora prolificans]
MITYFHLEEDKLDIFHHAFLEAVQSLYTAPVYFRHRSQPNNQDEGQNPPRRAGKQILDLGTGTGLWAMSMAEEYPDITAFGVDFYDFLQPREILRSTFFCGHINIEKDWDPIHQFVDWAAGLRRADSHTDPGFDSHNWDLIYARMLNGAIHHWPNLFQNIYNHLTPGFGCVEIVDLDWTPRCDDGTFPQDSHFEKWFGLLNQAMETIGRPLKINPNTKNLLIEAGFVDVEEKVYKIYHNPWKRGGHEEQTGRWFNLGLTYGLQGMSLAPLTRIIGMGEDEVNELVEKVRHEVCLLKHHGYCNL